MEISLFGKKALVTGASGGLGRSIALALGQCGADVALHYFSDEKSVLVTAEKLHNIGRKARIFKADLRDEKQVISLRDSVEKDFGLPDILVINAVVQYAWKPLLEQDTADYYSQFESCVMQAVYLAKAFVPYMKQQHYGKIIAINTECAMLAEPTCSAYTAAKRGLDGIMRVLAKELGGDNITVNQIAPGWTVTERERENGVNPAPEYVATVPLARRGTDTDIANTAAFLASDLASFITGAFIPVNGGRIMPCI